MYEHRSGVDTVESVPIVLLPNPATLFEDPYGKSGFSQVRQGEEVISAEDWLVSFRFAQCSAQILINQYDGSTLLKHVGPQAFEVVFGGTSGLSPQDDYRLFAKHARQTGANVLALNVGGDIGRHQVESRSNVLEGINVIHLPDLHVESGANYTWDLAYNPVESLLVTRSFQSADEPIYHAYRLRNAYSRSAEHTESREVLQNRSEQNARFKQALRHLGELPLSSPAFQKIAETKEAILGSESRQFLAELRAFQLDTVEHEWVRSYVRAAEVREDVNELTAGIEALQIFIEASLIVRNLTESPQRRVHLLSSIALSAALDLSKKESPVRRRGISLLLAELEQAIAGLPSPTLEQELKIERAIQSDRDICLSILDEQLR